MSAKHTPGPWQINPVNAQVDAFNTGEGLAICKMLWPTKLRSEAETEANARLIAAAPELYEAVSRARRHAMNIGLDAEGSTYIHILDAAIARATGDA